MPSLRDPVRAQLVGLGLFPFGEIDMCFIVLTNRIPFAEINICFIAPVGLYKHISLPNVLFPRALSNWKVVSCGVLIDKLPS